jgi:pimeloyl-ACP methyl ester carboxylesterase
MFRSNQLEQPDRGDDDRRIIPAFLSSSDPSSNRRPEDCGPRESRCWTSDPARARQLVFVPDLAEAIAGTARRQISPDRDRLARPRCVVARSRSGAGLFRLRLFGRHRRRCSRARSEGCSDRRLEPRRARGAQRSRSNIERGGPDGFSGFKGLSATAFTPSPSDAEIEEWLKSAFAPGYAPIPDFAAADFRNTDGNARGYLGASVQAGRFADEVEIVRNLTVPLAIVQGGEEQIVDLGYLQRLPAPTLWRGKVQVIDGAGHATQWEKAEAFGNILDEFASSLPA